MNEQWRQELLVGLRRSLELTQRCQAGLVDGEILLEEIVTVLCNGS